MGDEKGSSLGTGGTAGPGTEALAFPVEFELRVIYELAKAEGLAAALERTLAEKGASPGKPRQLPAKPSAASSQADAAAAPPKYGRMACAVSFQDKDAMYAAYAAVGALPGVKAVL